MDDVVFELLSRTHDRRSFDCGEPSMNEHLTRYALQNQEINYARTFVAITKTSPTTILSYYTLCAASFSRDVLPSPLQKHLPRYPVPAVRMARLAVDLRVQGKGLGEFTILRALLRVARVSRHIGIAGVEVHALNEQIRAFYINREFVELLDGNQHLFLPIKKISDLAQSLNEPLDL